MTHPLEEIYRGRIPDPPEHYVKTKHRDDQVQEPVPFNPPRFKTSLTPPTEPGITFTQPSRTKQEFLAESDINTILAKYSPQDLAPRAGGREPIYGDFSDPELTDYALSLRRVMGMQDLMQRLPAKVRERFNYSPQAILAFVQSPANREEAIQLGLIESNAPEGSPGVPPGPPAPPNKEGSGPGPKPTPTPSSQTP